VKKFLSTEKYRISIKEVVKQRMQLQACGANENSTRTSVGTWKCDSEAEKSFKIPNPIKHKTNTT
jgi:ribosomal protein L37AE/L43A